VKIAEGHTEKEVSFERSLDKLKEGTSGNSSGRRSGSHSGGGLDGGFGGVLGNPAGNGGEGILCLGHPGVLPVDDADLASEVSQGEDGLGVDILSIDGDIAMVSEVIEELGVPLVINAGENRVAELQGLLVSDRAKPVQLGLGDRGDIQLHAIDEILQVLLVSLSELTIDGIPQFVVLGGELGNVSAILPDPAVVIPLGVAEEGSEQTGVATCEEGTLPDEPLHIQLVDGQTLPIDHAAHGLKGVGRGVGDDEGAALVAVDKLQVKLALVNVVALCLEQKGKGSGGTADDGEVATVWVVTEGLELPEGRGAS